MISGMGIVLWEGMVYFLWGCQFILCPFSHFEIQDFKNLKLFDCCALIFNIHIFRFKIDAGLQVDPDFTINLKFLLQRAVCLSPLVDTQNQPNLWYCFHCYPFDRFRGHSKPSSLKSQRILCECKQIRQLLVKIQIDLFVNYVLLTSLYLHASNVILFTF